MKFKKICVLGLGYIGLPTAATFARHGMEVLGVDINAGVIDTLRGGGVHIHEPGLGEIVQQAIASGRLTVAAEPAPADAFIIAVPTPFHEDMYGRHNDETYRLADMRAVTAAARSILPHLRPGNLVVLESTSPPRTTVDLIVPLLEASGLHAGRDFHVCYSPERVLPGQILRELIENARVIGGVTPESASLGAELYATFVKGEIVQTDATTAEMVKLMENTYRDVNIAIANEFSRLAERFGVDVWETIALANRHPRVKILSPGPGVGGHCISVDPWFLVEAAPELTPLILHARQVNATQPLFVIEKIRQAIGDLAGKQVAALGLAYKADVDDLRESPAVEVVHLLTNLGARVRAYEPFKPEADLKGIETVPSLQDALANADALLLLVNHTQFRDFDPTEIAGMTPARLVIDAVHGWEEKPWSDAGFRFFRLGANKTQLLNQKS
ncbi:MAG TPA: nucleotide sugar dehydrogenase [Anaerolineales bacterium]